MLQPITAQEKISNFLVLTNMAAGQISPLVEIPFFLMIRRPPRSTQSRSSAASDVYKRQDKIGTFVEKKCHNFSSTHPFELILVSNIFFDILLSILKQKYPKFVVEKKIH